MVAGRFVIVLILAALLGGCGGKPNPLWSHMTSHTWRYFFAASSCQDPMSSYIEITRYRWHQVMSWSAVDTRTTWQGFSGGYVSDDGGSFRFAYLDDLGNVAISKVYIMWARDAFLNQIPAFQPPLYGVYVPERGQTRATDFSSGLCVVMTAVPWATAGERPWFVWPWMLTESLSGQQAIRAATGILLFLLLFVFIGAALLIHAGFVDESNVERRVLTVGGSIGAGLLILLVMLPVRNATMVEPLEERERFRAYYAFYDALAKGKNGALLPLDGQAFIRIYWAPNVYGTPEDYEQTPRTFFKWLLIFLGAYAVGFGYFIFKGIYWVFVPLPLRRTFEEAAAKGKWPTAEEIRKALKRGSANLTGWQSKMMSMKAADFKRELEAMRDKLRAKVHG